MPVVTWGMNCEGRLADVKSTRHGEKDVKDA